MLKCVLIAGTIEKYWTVPVLETNLKIQLDIFNDIGYAKGCLANGSSAREQDILNFQNIQQQ